jgi:hypothetical protein
MSTSYYRITVLTCEIPYTLQAWQGVQRAWEVPNWACKQMKMPGTLTRAGPTGLLT